MTIEKLSELMDLYSDTVAVTAMCFLHNKDRACDVTYYTFSSIMDNDVTNEEVIFLIANCELHYEFYNLALNRKHMTMTQKIFKRGMWIAQKLHTWRFRLLQKEIEVEFGHAPLWVVAGTLIACMIFVYGMAGIVSWLISK